MISRVLSSAPFAAAFLLAIQITDAQESGGLDEADFVFALFGEYTQGRISLTESALVMTSTVGMVIGREDYRTHKGNREALRGVAVWRETISSGGLVGARIVNGRSTLPGNVVGRFHDAVLKAKTPISLPRGTNSQAMPTNGEALGAELVGTWRGASEAQSLRSLPISFSIAASGPQLTIVAASISVEFELDDREFFSPGDVCYIEPFSMENSGETPASDVLISSPTRSFSASWSTSSGGKLVTYSHPSVWKLEGRFTSDSTATGTLSYETFADNRATRSNGQVMTVCPGRSSVRSTTWTASKVPANAP